jgi:hypothetical protein
MGLGEACWDRAALKLPDFGDLVFEGELFEDVPGDFGGKVVLGVEKEREVDAFAFAFENGRGGHDDVANTVQKCVDLDDVEPFFVFEYVLGVNVHAVSYRFFAIITKM